MIDIYSINDDGNILDAAALASVVALRTAKMPVYDEKEEKIKFGEFTKDALPLTENIPFSMTFHKIGEKIIIDPNRDEEDSAESRLTLAISQFKKEHFINSMQKGKIVPLSGEDLKMIVEQAEKVYDKVFPDIDKKTKALI